MAYLQKVITTTGLVKEKQIKINDIDKMKQRKPLTSYRKNET